MVDVIHKPSFKTCTRLGEIMRITDPRWPAVREIARTVLRTEALVVKGPAWLEPLIHRINVLLGDVQPSRTEFPEFLLETENKISLLVKHANRPLAQCGRQEPSIEVVWLPMDTEGGWTSISAVVTELLEAGYPGCLGCGGPNSEEEWDESSSRKSMLEFIVDGS